LVPSVAEALFGADVLVIATEWPEFATLDGATVVAAMRRPIVLDQGGFAARGLAGAADISYFRVGKPS
jgi:UDPglucose 6-dehydrogenase